MNDLPASEAFAWGWRYLCPVPSPDQLAALIAAGREGQVGNPDFLDWIGDRLEHVYHESPNIDFVQAARRKAKVLRAALKPFADWPEPRE